VLDGIVAIATLGRALHSYVAFGVQRASTVDVDDGISSRNPLGGIWAFETLVARQSGFCDA
jgi:hypothetical protein